MGTGRIRWLAWAKRGLVGLLSLLIWPDLPVVVAQNRPGQIRVQIRRGNVMPGRAADQNGTDETPDSVFYPPDRETLQKLSMATELIGQERYGEAVRLLSDILESPEDYFFQPDRQQRNYRSLKSEAQRLLGAMPTAGKASYELQFGAEARRMLDAAVEKGDLAGVAEVSRKYFHTRAGYEATYLLGMAQLQRGEPVAAALSLGRLQGTSAAEQFDPSLSLNLALCWARADRAEQAVALLKDLNRRMPNAAIRVAGAERKGFASDAQALSWLAEVAPPSDAHLDASQWSMYRGSPSRNAASAGSSPLLNRRWSVPVADHPRVEELLSKLAQDHVEQSSRLLPGLHPLAVRDYVFMRSLTGLVGVDFQTGKRIWVENEKEQQTNALVDALAQPPGSRGSAALTNWLQRRVWDSAVYGTLASDGELIYCIDEAEQGSFTDEVAAVDQQMHRQMLFNPRPFTRGSNVQGHNRLVAYEIASQGKLVGEIDTRPGDIAHALSGGYFLGPPLPLAGRLYVLAEIKGEIRLFVLDPKKLRGDNEAENDSLPIDWSQQLVVLDPVVFEEPLRRLAGATPSFSDGILVCPTSAGAVVAVDLTTRSLLWGYQYPRANDAYSNRLMIRFPGMQATGEPAEDDRWADATVTIADGHVLLSPLESGEIFCLGLTDGAPKWHKPRDDGLYIACVYDGKAVIVGSRSVKALKLADGEPAWPSSLALPPGGASGSTPSGRGFYNGSRYYLPLSSAEVVAIDLDQGQIVARSRSRTGTVPGNLICYQGAVISQGVDHVESFYQLDELRQQVAATLANSPDDAEALARQGELLLDEGKFDEAVAELRRSFDRKSDPRTRELLVDGMLESLRLDFARHRDLVPEIERLADQPSEHAKLARLLAGGLQQTGEVAAAFEAYLRMVDLTSDPQPTERVDSGLSVRRDRWVRARLNQLYEAASADDRRLMQNRVGALLEKSGEQDFARLKRFLGYFAYHPLADEARQRLAEHSLDTKNWLEAEHWLRQLEQSPDAARQRAAVARLAQLFCDAARPADAVAYYERLAGPWADEVCLGGRRGREIAHDLAARPQFARYVHRDAGWPQGKVEIHTENVPNGQVVRSVPIELRGSLRPFHGRATIEVDANMQQNSLLGRDGFGHEQWRLALRDRNDNLGLNPAIDYVRADGHLVVLSLGYQLVGIDTLGTPSSGARVLWKQEISESLGGLPRQFAMNPRLNVRLGMGGQHMQPVDANGRPVGNTSPIMSELVCFQRMRDLMAVDPLTGETVWARHDVPSGCELFGDEELLFAVPPGATEAIVLRALDGEELGRRELPVSEKRMLTRGRFVLDWEPAPKGSGRLRLFDVWKQAAAWTKEFDGQAKFCPVADEAVAVIERNGRLTVLSLPEGAATIEEALPAERSLAEVYLLRSPQIDVVIVNRQQPRNANFNVMPAPMNAAGAAGAVVNGMVYGFDRQTGKKLWGREVLRKAVALNRPADLPVLLFASNTQRAGRMPQQPQGELAVMDKRTGKMLLEKKVNQLMAVDATGDFDQHEVTVHTPRETFRLKFTDEPDESAEAGRRSATSAAGRALWRALRNQLEPYREAMDDQAEAIKEALGIEDDPFAE